MKEISEISIKLLILSVAYQEKMMAAASAQKPVATMLHNWAELELQAQGEHLGLQFMKIYSSATTVSIDLNNVILDQSKVICRLLTRILCSGDWNINRGT